MDPDLLPAQAAGAEHLGWASRQLTAIEVNATYHSTQSPEIFAAWRAQVPDGFRFAVKAPRWALQTTDAAKAAVFVRGFRESGLAELGDALGPILWQFPPKRTYQKAAYFAGLLPDAINGLPLRQAIEAQHPSFAAAAAMLGARGIACVVLELAGEGPTPDAAAAGFDTCR